MSIYKTPKMPEPVPRQSVTERPAFMPFAEITDWEEIAETGKSRVAFWEQLMATLKQKRSSNPGTS